MINAKILANAVTTVWVTGYVICALFTYIAPNFVFGIASTWFHSINIDAIRTSMNMPIINLLFGIVSFGAVIWIGTFTVARLYNYWVKGSK
ncbi:MAG: DUF5676 family membrane protein [Patescibacteria group bacterium]